MKQTNYLGLISNDVGDEPMTYYIDENGIYRVTIYPFDKISLRGIGNPITKFLDRVRLYPSMDGFITRLPDYLCE